MAERALLLELRASKEQRGGTSRIQEESELTEQAVDYESTSA